MHHFLFTEQALAHQVFRQQGQELGVAMALQGLELRQYAIDLARGAEAGGAMWVLRGHGQSSLLLLVGQC